MTDRCYRLPSGAVVRAPEPPTPALVSALEALADAARAAFAANPGYDELVAQQAAARERNRARLVRLGVRPGVPCSHPAVWDCPPGCSCSCSPCWARRHPGE